MSRRGPRTGSTARPGNRGRPSPGTPAGSRRSEARSGRSRRRFPPGRRGSPAAALATLLQVFLEALDGGVRADARRLVARHLADGGGDQVGRADYGFGRRRARVLKGRGYLLPRHARQHTWRVHRAGERIAVAHIDERDRPRRVVLVENLLLGGGGRLQRISIPVRALDRAE